MTRKDNIPRCDIPHCNIPLCVDLDDTLVRTDTLHESLLLLIKRRPLTLVYCLLWSLPGRAHFKEQVAQRVSLEPQLLPYNEPLLAVLRAEAATGRPVYLATAAHESIAKAIAQHSGLFSGVYATAGEVNLKGTRKNRLLVEQFGEGGFDYIGDSASDIPIFRSARRAVLISAGGRSAEHIQKQVAIADVLREECGSKTALFDALRTPRWAFNLIIFLPLLFLSFTTLQLRHTFLAFFVFSLTLSFAFVLCDLLGIESDRRDAIRRGAPFACGAVRIKHGIIMLGVLASATASLLLFLPAYFVIVFLCYAILATFYAAHAR